MNKAFLILLGILVPLGACAAHRTRVTEDAVYLYLKAPQAKLVEFATSLDGYQPRPAIRLEDGTWETVVSRQQEFKYFYIVDGRAFTPSCPLKEKDDFGSENCIFVPEL